MYRAFIKNNSTMATKSSMAAKKLKLIVFLGSSRDGRLGERVGRFVVNSLKDKHDVELLGIYGGMRAAMQLRALTGELGCISVSNIFGIPKVHEAIDADGTPLDSHMDSGLKKLMTQLEWTAIAFKNMRDTQGIPS